MKKKVLISACLLGKKCRYNGEHSHLKKLDDLDVNWFPVCPEEAGKLGTPRPAAEMQGTAESIMNGKGSILTNNGKDVTGKFINGAEVCLEKGLLFGAKHAILKSLSPSCGTGGVYDGTFSNSIKKEDGIFAYLCSNSGMHCISSDDANQIKKTFQKKK